jgi:hypothetical protein
VKLNQKRPTPLQKRAQEVGFHRAALEAGATITDGPLPCDFREGWAHQITFKTHSMIAHYWTKHPDPELEAEMVAKHGERGRGAAIATSACGLERLTTKSVPLMGPGNLPFCARCEGKLMRGMRPGGAAK